jgi:hypothetical protein
MNACYGTLVKVQGSGALATNGHEREGALLRKITDILGLVCVNELEAAVDEFKDGLLKLEPTITEILEKLSQREVTEEELDIEVFLNYIYDAPKRLQQNEITEEKFLVEVVAFTLNATFDNYRDEKHTSPPMLPVPATTSTRADIRRRTAVALSPTGVPGRD